MAVALVTGASRGFGRALALDLARDGWDLVLDARGEDALRRTAAEAVALGATVVAVPGDVADERHQDELARAAGSFGRLDLLVNNASLLGPSPQPTLDRYPIDVLGKVYRVNVLGPLGVIQHCLPLLRETAGVIVNVTSDAGVEGYEGWGGYGSSKAALEQLSHVLATEQPDLHVYWFDPGDMRTKMHQEAFPDEDISDRPEPETVVPALRRLLADRPPSGRYRATALAERAQ